MGYKVARRVARTAPSRNRESIEQDSEKVFCSVHVVVARVCFVQVDFMNLEGVALSRFRYCRVCAFSRM